MITLKQLPKNVTWISRFPIKQNIHIKDTQKIAMGPNAESIVPKCNNCCAQIKLQNAPVADESRVDMMV